jgi:hypothetical protein
MKDRRKAKRRIGERRHNPNDRWQAYERRHGDRRCKLFTRLLTGRLW